MNVFELHFLVKRADFVEGDNYKLSQNIILFATCDKFYCIDLLAN